MFESILNFFKSLRKTEKASSNSGGTAKERLHLVLMQDRANVSADFLELMKQEIIDVIKKYIEIDESAIDVRLTNKNGEDGENSAPALYANIPILNIRNDMKKIDPATGRVEPDKKPESEKGEKQEENKEEATENKEEKIEENNKGEAQEEVREEKSKEENKDKQEEKTEQEDVNEKVEDKKEDKEEEKKEENKTE